MKPFACEYCSYSSNYKHDLKRHQKTHQNHDDQQNITQHEQQINSSHTVGYPVQALNLANNIQVPATTKQIINIQPPSTTTTTPHITTNVKKPIIHDENNNSFDIRLKENFKIFINGPSRSGKTVFITELLKNIDIFCKAPPKIITLVYKIFQPIYHEMGAIHLVPDGDCLKEKLMNIAHGEPMLVIFDDLINSDSLPNISDLFVVDGRHMNLSLIFISQKLFINNDSFREISQNCDYYILFKNPRNSQEIRTLASQMTPGKMQLISYYTEATKNPFSYLFINLTQECQLHVKYLNYLFNIPHIVKVYNNATTMELNDGFSVGRTNFAKMYLKSNNIPPMLNGNDNSGSSKHSMSTGTDDIPRQDVGVSTNNTHSVGTESDVISKQDVSTETDNIPRQDIGVSAGSKHSAGTQTDVISTQDAGVSTGSKHSVGTETDVITTHDAGVSTNSRRSISTKTDDILKQDIGVASNNVASVSTETDSFTDNNLESAIGMEQTLPVTYTDYSDMISNNNNTPRHYSYRAINRPDFSRPEREMRLNIPIHNLIRRRPNRYQDYHEYTDDEVAERRSITYENENLLPASKNGEVECNQCNEIFANVNALRKHAPQCQPNIYPCYECGKGLASRNALTSHVTAMHQNRRDIREMERV